MNPRGAAFSLVELLVVIGVVVVLAAMTLPIVPSMMRNADRADALAKIRTMGTAVLQYAPDHVGLLPPLFPGQVLEYEEGRGGRIVTECAAYLGIEEQSGKYLVTPLMPRAYARLDEPKDKNAMRVYVMNTAITNNGTVINPFGRVTTPGKPPTGNTTLASLAGTENPWMMSTADQKQPNVASSAHRFRIETVADGLEHPWAVAKLPDGDFLVTERAGRVLRIGKDGTKTPVAGVPEVVVKGQGGLLDLVLHPQYEENGWIYLAYAKPLPGGSMTAVARARLKDDRLQDLEMVFDPPADQASNTGLHFGCRIVFDGRGHVFFSIGDRGGPTNPENLAQSLASVTGKIHRLHDDGRVPGDNPFVGRKDAMPSIWAYGSRNAQGLVYDTATDRLWETEHGPRGGDELNIIRKGANYGWPLATYGINYSGTTISKNKSLPGMEDPVVQWTPVIAASGLALYRGDKFPRWRGNLFAGGLASEKLVRLELNGAAVTEQEIVLQDTGRIRDVRAFDDGFLYLVYDEPGKVVRLVPTD